MRKGRRRTMEQQMQEKSLQYLALTLGDLYDAVYEVEVYKDALYIWKEKGGQIGLPAAPVPYWPVVQSISER